MELLKSLSKIAMLDLLGIFFIIIGAITAFFIFINLFTTYAEMTLEPSIKTQVDLDEPLLFEEILASTMNSRVESGSPVTILTNGEEFLADLLLEIEKAHESIYITNFIWQDGKFGQAIEKALKQKAEKGVEVRLLIDGVGGAYFSQKNINKLTKKGIKFAFFRPLTWWNLDRLNRRTHIRDYVIDNKIVYLGGIAIADAWLGNATKPDEWHDYMYKASGKMAEEGNRIFKNIWSQTTGEFLLTPKTKQAPLSPGPDKVDQRFISLLSVPAPDLSCNLENFIWLSIMAAKKSIHIQNPYLLPSKCILEALKKKAKEGVDIKIILPGKNTDTPHTRWASHTFYSVFLKVGIRIYEYLPSRMHAKVIVIDEKWSIIGSANLDNRSSKINLEWILGIHDKELGQDIEKKFQEDLGRTREITKSRWSRASYLLIPIQRIAVLFSQLY